MDRIGRLALIALSVLAVLYAGARPAAASCAEAVPLDQAIDEAHTVFVGEVLDVRHGGVVAVFAVEEVWKGSPGTAVVVTGGASPEELDAAAARGQQLATSADRIFSTDVRYLVVAYARDGEVLRDNDCTATQAYTTALDVYRPASPEPPPPAPDGGGTSPGWAIAAGAAVAGVATGTVWWSLRRRREARV